jgi:hypothetical protein
MKQPTGTGIGIALVLAASGSCASEQYVFRPAEQVTASVEGQPAAGYSIPPESPRGAVYVTSLGIGEARVSNDSDATGKKAALLQMRMLVSNDSDDQAWIVDTREQFLEIPGVGRSRPAYVNTDHQGAPVIEIPRGERRTVDLFYPLPQNLQKTDKLPPFELVWNVRTGTRVVAHRTPFEKVPLYAESAYGLGPTVIHPELALSLGWGPVWWYDPFYPALSFAGPVVVTRPVPVFTARPVRGPAPRVMARPNQVWRGRPPQSR